VAKGRSRQDTQRNPGDLTAAAEIATSRDDRAINILASEYSFVSGLIPFYRTVEITALGGTGVTIAVLLGFVGALEATSDPNRSLEAALVSLASIVPAVLLLLELMALTRIMRASAYIRNRIFPIARELTSREDLLQWEFSPTRELVGELTTSERHGPPSRFTKLFASSAPVVTAIVTAAVGLPIAGVALAPDDAFEPAQIVGYVSGGMALGLGIGALVSTLRFEARGTDSK
jgi:hypothetical protein